jgi:predicted ribosomally synthesized peptide with nif11-like leader
MSAQEDLLNLVSTNPEFRQSISEATTPEDAVRLAADFGVKITVEDVLSAFQSTMSELSSEELEAVSGGQKQGNTAAITRCEIDCGEDPRKKDK